MEQLDKILENAANGIIDYSPNEIDILHFEKFGVYPNDIGFCETRNELDTLILQAIKINKPYNEYNELDSESKKCYDEGLLRIR